MKRETFWKEKERVETLSEQEQKHFYAGVLEREQVDADIRMEAYFQYAVLFYYEGNFKKTIDVLEPFIISCQSYEYSDRMVSCFNLMGVAAQCEGQYLLARHCYTSALKVVREQHAKKFFAREYNNISLTYIAEENYEAALKYIEMAEQYLPDTEENMGAYIYLNKSDIYNHFDKPKEAEESFQICIREYDGTEELPEDVLICGASLFHRTGDMERYREYRDHILNRMEDMYASEFIDACKTVFACSLEDGDYALVEKVIAKMDSYMESHPEESRVGLQVEELKYEYAKKTGNIAEVAGALERKNGYYGQIVLSLEKQRIVSMEEYIDTHRHLQQAVLNETQANRAKTRFLANMSHDIRTPMNVIVGAANLMEHSLEDPEKLKNYLEKLQTSSQHMLGLINNLLDMNKIESGVTELHKEPIRLSAQIGQLEEIARMQAGGKRQKLEVHKKIRHECLIADGVRLRQVLLNVLTNAVKYTPEEGHIRFEIEEFPADTEGFAKYRFQVSDNGVGMDQELLSHIFEPFIRGEDSMVNKIQGTGLGMAITKRLVDLMGGFIWIDSRPGEGSCVKITIEFEIDKEAENRKTEAKAQEASEEKGDILKGMRFLCAEDNELNVEILRDSLEIEGASCTVYADGARLCEAFESVKPGEYDVILMDVQMPNMNGYEAARHIRKSANPLGAEIPIIAMTANAFTEDIEHCLASGMNAHIAKPIDMRVLEETVRSLKI